MRFGPQSLLAKHNTVRKLPDNYINNKLTIADLFIYIKLSTLKALTTFKSIVIINSIQYFTQSKLKFGKKL